MLVFHVIIHVILYILVSQNIEGQREREKERERVNVKKSTKLALVLDAYDLNLSTILSKLDTVLQCYLRF